MKIQDFLENYLDYWIVDDENERFYIDIEDMDIILMDLLELAAENARTMHEPMGSLRSQIVDKDTILNTLES